MTADAIFRRERTIRDVDLDQLGHVNNTVWVQFIVELADAHSTANGFGWKVYRELGGMWIVRRHEIDYIQPATLGERLVEETWVASMRGARSERRCRFTRTPDGTVAVRSVTQWAFVDTSTHRPRRVLPEVLQAFTPTEGP